ncbi:hypothetical protein K474DRAFT_1601716 [Panus rudis PR-1116 ss-1]|nr:hypothetical protein K474DRAFT_1601716 [Panus rudis PR-1116 ss-1]
MSDDSDSGDLQQEIFAAYARLFVENYCILASSVLLFFDCIVTLPLEVETIWGRKLSGATFVYFFTRYGAVAERITLVTSLFLQTTSDTVCAPVHLTICRLCAVVLRMDDVLTNLTFVAVGAFMSLRLYGIYGGWWPPVILMASIWIARITLSIYRQTDYSPLAFGGPLFGCGGLFNHSKRLYYLDIATNVLVLLADAVLLVLTWAKTWRIRWQSSRLGVSTPVTTLLLRDVLIIRYSIIFIIQSLAIVSSGVGVDFILWDVWVYFVQVVTPIALSRFMLNLRGINLDSYPSDIMSTHPPSELHFASRVVGNLAAPLRHTLPSTGSSSTTSDEGTLSIPDLDLAEPISKDPFSEGLGITEEEIEMTRTSATEVRPEYPLLQFFKFSS